MTNSLTSQDNNWESYGQYDVKTDVVVESNEEVKVQDIVSENIDYTYASFGKDNPFVPPLLSTHLAKLEIPIVSILQRYRLDELSLVGTWELENSDRKALVMTPKDEGVIVTVGDLVGNKGGKIVGIAPKSIKIREFTLAPDGTRQFEDYQIYLGDEVPEDDEKIIIKSNKLSETVNDTQDNNKDFFESSDTEVNRQNSFMNNTVDSASIDSQLNNLIEDTVNKEARKNGMEGISDEQMNAIKEKVKAPASKLIPNN